MTVYLTKFKPEFCEKYILPAKRKLPSGFVRVNIDSKNSYRVKVYIDSFRKSGYGKEHFSHMSAEELRSNFIESNTFEIKDPINDEIFEYWKEFFITLDNYLTIYPMTQEQFADSYLLLSQLTLQRCVDPTLISKIVPQSSLRIMYRSSKDNWAKSLTQLFDQAINGMKHYVNTEPYVSVSNTRTQSKATKNIKPSTTIQEYMVEKFSSENIKIRNSNTVLRFLDYEVNFLRTSKGINADGSSARYSSRGGVDLVCFNPESNLPVIVEYKSMNDKSLEYAIGQSLTYSSELLTSQQIDRFNNSYALNVDKTNPKVEICLLYDKNKESKEALTLAKSLMKMETIKLYINCIYFLELQQVGSNFEFVLNEKI